MYREKNHEFICNYYQIQQNTRITDKLEIKYFKKIDNVYCFINEILIQKIKNSRMTKYVIYFQKYFN